jgi:hypothetical protein
VTIDLDRSLVRAAALIPMNVNLGAYGRTGWHPIAPASLDVTLDGVEEQPVMINDPRSRAEIPNHESRP